MGVRRVLQGALDPPATSVRRALPEPRGLWGQRGLEALDPQGRRGRSVPQVLQGRPGRSGRRVPWGPPALASPAPRGLSEIRAPWDPLGQSDRRGRRGLQVLRSRVPLAPREDRLARQVISGPRVRREISAPPDPVEVLRVRPDRASPGPRDPPAPSAQRDPSAPPDRSARPDRASRVQQVRSESRDPLGGRRVRREISGLRGPPEISVRPAPPGVLRVRRDLDPRARSAPRDRSDRRAPSDRRDPREPPRASRAQPDPSDPPDLRAPRGTMEPLDRRALAASLDPRVTMDRRDPRVQRVLKVPRAPQVSPDPPAQEGPPDRSDRPAPPDPSVPRDPLGLRALQASLDPRDLPDRSAPRVLEERRVPRDRQAPRDLSAPRAPSVRSVLQVPKARSGRPDQRVLRVLLGPEALSGPPVLPALLSPDPRDPPALSDLRACKLHGPRTSTERTSRSRT